MVLPDDVSAGVISSKLPSTCIVAGCAYSVSKSWNDQVLPDDLWVDIVCRLPPKHIVRCKSVSKSWNKLICDICIPRITSAVCGLLFPLRSTSGTTSMTSWDLTGIDGTARKENGEPFLRSCFLPFTPVAVNFIDSRNGLILFFHYETRHYYVCNPLTEQYIAFPNCRIYENCPERATLTFDPHINVVRISTEPLRMLIYSSVTCKWVAHKVLYSNNAWRSGCISSLGIYLDGALYHLSSTWHVFKFCLPQVSLEPKQPNLEVIDLPNIVRRKYPSGSIGASSGRLNYAWPDHDTYQLFVWVLDGSQWVLKHTISLLDVGKYLACVDLFPYGFHPTSDVLFLGQPEVGIVQYDPGSRNLTRIYGLRKGTSLVSGQLLSFYPFSWNLAPLVDYSGSIKQKPNETL